MEFDAALKNARTELAKLSGMQLQNAQKIDSVLIASLAEHFQESCDATDEILRKLNKYYSEIDAINKK